MDLNFRLLEKQEAQVRTNRTLEHLVLTFSVLQTDTFANSVDPDEAARNELSHQGVHVLSFWFCLFGWHPDLQQWTSKFKAWRGDFRNLAVNGLKYKHLQLHEDGIYVLKNM